MSATSVLRAQLEAIRANAEAALALLGDEPPSSVVAAACCDHPTAKRTPAPVGGDPGQFLCQACHSLVPGAAP